VDVDLNKDKVQKVASLNGVLEGGKAGARRGPLGAVIGAIIGGLAAEQIEYNVGRRQYG